MSRSSGTGPSGRASPCAPRSDLLRRIDTAVRALRKAPRDLIRNWQVLAAIDDWRRGKGHGHRSIREPAVAALEGYVNASISAIMAETFSALEDMMTPTTRARMP